MANHLDNQVPWKLGACILALAIAGCATKPGGEKAPVEDLAPVMKAAAAAPVGEPEGNYYVVQKGDTLTRIAAKHKVSIADLTTWNNISDPNRVEVDQRLRVVPPGAATPTRAAAPVAAAAPAPTAKPVAGEASTQPVTAVAPVESRPLPPAAGQTAPAKAAAPQAAPAQAPAQAVAAPPAQPQAKPLSADKHEPVAGKQPYSEQNLAKARAAAGLPPLEPKPAADPKAGAKPADAKTAAKPGDAKSTANLTWAWPAPGKIAKGFNASSNKGVDIAGQPGEPVVATASGKVVYVGAMKEYGRLIIVKHNAQFLSAYSDPNANILVKEGDAVTQGQKLAEMGKGEGGGRVHFQIRQQGKPVDPMKFLPPRE